MVWWDQFQDPVLSDLVRTALANNKDLQIATANIDQALAQYGITRSAQFPQINLGASAGRPAPKGAEAAATSAPLPPVGTEQPAAPTPVEEKVEEEPGKRKVRAVGPTFYPVR